MKCEARHATSGKHCRQTSRGKNINLSTAGEEPAKNDSYEELGKKCCRIQDVKRKGAENYYLDLLMTYV